MTIPSQPPKPIPFIDLQAQRRRLGSRIDEAIMAAVNGGAWVSGPQVREFEEKLADFGRAKHVLSCANGTDALILPLRAWDIGPGDAVFCPSFTFCATAEAVAWLGATPVFVDVLPDTFNMDPEGLIAAIDAIKSEGRLKPRAVIGVCLFGQAANYPVLAKVARGAGMKILADSAQGFGTTIGGAHPLEFVDCVTTSFFPAKPLGCYGDGGAILTNDSDLAEIIDSLRVHGRAMPRDIAAAKFEHDPKYLNVRVGINSRLDTIQAAILLEKLAIFPEDVRLRGEAAARYSAALDDIVDAPPLAPNTLSTWAQYTIQTDARDALVSHLKSCGVPTAVYYPVPLHQNVAYRDFPAPVGLPVTERLADRVLSLPISADLDAESQDYVVQCVRRFFGS